MKRLFNENDPHGSCPIANPAYDSSRTVRAERPGDSRGGYTLVELLVATTLTLFLLGAVAIVFGMVGQTVNESRATLEMTDRLRAVTARLQNDLEGVTVAMTPPIDPGTNQGYFKYIEGPNPLYRLDPTQYPSPQAGVWPNAANTDQVDGAGNPMPDTTVIDHNDIVMFTTRAKEKPFVGRAFQVMPNGELRRQAESQVAEVAWFVRGRTLYRRVLLVLPDFDADLTTSAREPALSFAQLATAAGYPAGTDFSFYQFYDLSVRRHRNGTPHDLTDDYLIPNSLGDLTKPENRFAHQSPNTESDREKRNWDCPFHPHLQSVRGRPNMPFSTRLTAWRWLGLPTLKETAHHAWGVDSPAVSYPANAAGPLEVFTLNIDGNSAAVPASWAVNPYDLRVTPHPYDEQDPASGAWLPTTNFSMDPPRTRAEEDVVLDNVIGFDVKVWDPEAPVLQLTNGTTVTILHPGDRGYPASSETAEWSKIAAGTSAYSVVSRGAYVDLNYGPNGNLSNFSGAPEAKLALNSLNPGGTYDTWSTHYEADGVGNYIGTTVDPGTDGFDTAMGGAKNGIVDDATEKEMPPPYSAPLRGIKVVVRVYEPFSRKIREVTISQDFSEK